MSPGAALASPVFRLYAIITVGALVLSGVVIWQIRARTGRELRSARAAWIGWMAIVPLIAGAIFLGRVTTIVFLTFVSLLGFKEFARATGVYRDWFLTSVVYLGIIGVGVTALVSDPGLDRTGWYGLFMALPIYVICAILMVPTIRNRAQGQLQPVALAIVGFVMIGWMFGHLTFLADAKYAYNYLCYIILAVAVADIAAYVAGKSFGHRALRSRISPNKTWGGAIGALIVSMILPWIFAPTFPHFDTFDLLMIGVIVGVGAQLGDLAISVVKRDVGIKDMGAAIPGHGGVLDRIDSLIYVVPLFFHFIRQRYDIY